MRKNLGYLLFPALLGAAPALAQKFPDGAGKEATLQICGNCHEPDILFDHRQGRDEWVATIQKMITVGAEGTPEQFKEVLAYLAKNFGPAAATVNVNQAAAAELESGLGLTAKEAAAIVKHRTDKGAFKTI